MVAYQFVSSILLYVVLSSTILAGDSIDQLSQYSQLDSSRLKSTIGALQLAQELWTSSYNEDLSNLDTFQLLQEAHAVANNIIFNSPTIPFVKTQHITFEKNYLECPVLSPCGELVVGVNTDNELVKINLRTADLQSVVAEDCRPNCITFDNQERIIYTYDNQIVYFKNKLNESNSANFDCFITDDPLVTLAAHKTNSELAMITNHSHRNVIALLDVHKKERLDIATLNKYKKRNPTMKWNPKDTTLAVKHGTHLSLYDIRSNRECGRFSDVSASTQFDFNSNGTLICVGTKNNNCSVIDLRTCKKISTSITLTSNRLCNIYNDLFLIQAEPFDKEVSVMRSTDCLTPRAEIKGTHTDISSPGTILPHTKTGNFCILNSSKKSFSTSYEHYIPITMLGTEIHTGTIRNYNLACIYALARARDEHEMAILTDNTFRDPVQDTATIDRSFKIMLQNLETSQKIS